LDAFCAAKELQDGVWRVVGRCQLSSLRWKHLSRRRRAWKYAAAENAIDNKQPIKSVSGIQLR
jgi:hypothetical protein